MKIKIDSTKKKIIIVLTLILFIASIILLIKEYTVKYYQNKEKIIYTFNTREYVDYVVIIKDDKTYGKIIYPNQDTYISKYIDSIDLFFNNRFMANTNANIKGKFDIKGKLIGFVGNEKEEKIIWSKDITYVPKKIYKCKTSVKDINEKIIINYNYYRDLCKKIKKETGVHTEQKLVITMNSEYIVLKNLKEKIVKSNISFEIPFSEDYFSLSKTKPVEGTENIIVKEKVNLPNNIKNTILLILLCFVSVIVNIFMWMYTTQPSESDKYIKNILKLLRNYDKYLVVINNNDYFEYTIRINVESFNDLVKISDEIERPIMYVKKDRIIDINEFFITDKGCTYVYMNNNKSSC